MADSTITVWVDSTFFNETSEGKGDVKVEFYPAAAENIGSYSIPVIFSLEEAVLVGTDVDLEYFIETTVISGHINVAQEYFIHELPKHEDVYTSLVEFSSGDRDKEEDRDLTTYYSAGYPPISGTLNERVVFTAGRKVETFWDVPVTFGYSDQISGTLNYNVNYSNFSGNFTSSGVPIPFYDSEWNTVIEYGGFNDVVSGTIDRIVEIFFAGWVDTPVTTDVYSTVLGYQHHYNYEVMISGGGVDVHYLDITSTGLSVSGTQLDIYCSLIDFGVIESEVETIDGRIARYRGDVYSTIKKESTLTMNVDLYSLKIANFSLDLEEYTEASNYISVDVLDDECPVSVSGTYFMVGGVRVPVTLSGIQGGYRMYYDPEDGFSSLEGPTTFTAHAENECGDSLEQVFYLTFGYIVEYDNSSGSRTSIDYGYDNKVAVRVTAENYASCPQVGSLAWDFESKELFNKDLGASIVGKAYGFETEGLSAKIKPFSTAYFYGKEFEVVLNAKDFAGNKMTPLILTYKIEDKPEN